jgi:hypothetical protein
MPFPSALHLGPLLKGTSLKSTYTTNREERRERGREGGGLVVDSEKSSKKNKITVNETIQKSLTPSWV